MPGSVIAGDRTLVAVSLDKGVELNLTVPASALMEPDSLIRGVPSARQKTRVSSGSTRLHAGQRFMFWREVITDYAEFADSVLSVH